MKPLFSIVIPTLNEELYISHLLDDLSNQKKKNFEVLLVDGASKDRTRQIAMSYQNRLPIRVFSVKQRNVSYQRNFGAYKSKGEYLVFLDADSGVYRGFTEQQEKYIHKAKGLVYIPYIVPDKRDSQTKIIFQAVNSLIGLSQVIGKPFSSGGAMTIERLFFKRIGGFDELFLSEDHAIIQKAYAWGVKPRYTKTVKVKFNLRRMRQEGELRLLYKYFVSALHVITKGTIKDKIFDYEMGGQVYGKKTNTDFFIRNFNRPIHEIKQAFIALLKED